MKPIAEAYRTAGELFFHLESKLGFGSLTMFASQSVVCFAWEFSASPSASLPRQHYRCQWNVPIAEFISDMQTEHEAERIATKWKNEHRKVTQ